MKTLCRLIALCSLLLASAAHAQWKNESYTLKSGWNAIYLHGEATHATPEALFASGAAANIDEVWRWNPNPNEVQFTETPLITSAGTPEWSKWVRGASENTLDALKGQSAYLIKCGTAQATYTVQILQKALPPSATWMRKGANLLGFPARTNGGNPKFSTYFATFPAAIAANTKIYKYIGGDLGPSNPLQIFSPMGEVLDRNQAYWFSSEVVGDFYAPIDIQLSNPEGLAFGRTLTGVTALIRNRTSASVTLTMAVQASDAPPAGQTAIQAQVPLTLGKLVGGVWNYDDPISGTNNTVKVGPQSTVELRFGINRAHASMSGAPVDASFASLLRMTDDGNLMDVYLPVTATKDSLAGLWAGDIQVTKVDSRVAADGRATARVIVNSSGVVTGLAVEDSGFGYPSTSIATVADTAGLTVGMNVGGPGLAGAATITSIIDSTHVELSQNIADLDSDLNYGGIALESATQPLSTVVTVPSTDDLVEGMEVFGPGIEGTATILDVSGPTSYVLSQNVPEATEVLFYTKSKLSSTSTAGDLYTIVTLPSTAGLKFYDAFIVYVGGQTYLGRVLGIIDETRIILGTNAYSSPTNPERLPDASYTFDWYDHYTADYLGPLTGSTVTRATSNVAVPSTAGLVVGDQVSGPGITGALSIIKITDATHLVLADLIPDATNTLTYSLALTSTSGWQELTTVTVADTTGLEVGTPVIGPGITGSARIVRILDGTRFSLGQDIADATNDLTYGTTVLSASVDTSAGVLTQMTVSSTAGFVVNAAVKTYSSAEGWSYYGLIVSVDSATQFTTIVHPAYAPSSVVSPPDGTRNVDVYSEYYLSGGYLGSFSGAMVSGAKTVAVADTSGLSAGDPVFSKGITGIATVASITDATHVVLSGIVQPGTWDLTFGTTVLSSTSLTPPGGTGVVTVSSSAGLTPGMAVTGPGITGTATILSITNATHLVLSQNIPDATNDLSYGTVTLSSTTTITPSTETTITVRDTTNMVVNGQVYNYVDYVGKITSIVDATHIKVIRDPAYGYPAPYLADGLQHISIWGPGFNASIDEWDYEFSTPPSPTITVSSTTGLVVGMVVTGAGIPAGITIASITDGTRLELSAAIAVGTRDLTFKFVRSSTGNPPSTTVTVASTADLTAGMSVTGPGIAGTATILSIVDGTRYFLSQAIEGGTNTLFYGGTVINSVIRSSKPPPTVVIGAPGVGGVQATATAIVSGGSVVGFTVTNGGSGYAAPPGKGPGVTILSPKPGDVPRSFSLRALLHVADDGKARLLSQVFVGPLAADGTPMGLCTKESGLAPGQKAAARRFSVSHLPLDRVIDDTSPGTNMGSVGLPSTLVRTVIVPFDDPTNPFVHQYHPDHDNRDARPDGTNLAKGNGEESYTVTRTLTFNFTESPPEGVSSVGWGSTVLGGDYSEVFSGLHRDALIVSGTFTLRRVSEIGTITTVNN